MAWWSFLSRRILPLISVVFAVLSAACLELREAEMVLDGSVEDGDREDCKSCHHTSDDEELTRCDSCHPAEPETAGHLAHGNGTLPSKPSSCDACHRTPEKWFDEGHLDAVVQVEFGDESLASQGGLDPSWNGSTCSNVYCHGASMVGGQVETPPWSSAESLTCGDCHGNPPLGSHPNNSQCEVCHGGGYLEDGSQDPDSHINGRVEMALKEGSR